MKIHKYKNIWKVISLNYNPYNSCNHFSKTWGCKILCVYMHSFVPFTMNAPKCIAKTSQNWRHKTQLVKWYNVPPWQWDKLHLRAWSWLMWTIPRICAIQVSTWDMSLHDMTTKLKQLWESTCRIFRVKTILKVFKNYPKKNVCK